MTNNKTITKKGLVFIFLLFLNIISSVSVSYSTVKTSDPLPELSYSWQDTVFSFSQELDWENETVTIEDSSNYSEVYNSIHYTYNYVINRYIVENRTVYHTANYSSAIERVTTGNMTLNMNTDVYRVNIDYGSGVKLIWFAMTRGTINYEYYLKKDVKSYTYYEQNDRHIVSHFEERDLSTDVLTDEWDEISDIPGEVNTTVSDKKEWYPFFKRLYWSADMVKPMILTVQIFNTEKNDKIAWAHLFHELFIFKDKNSDSILTIHDEEESTSLPTIATGTEFAGIVNPMAINQYTERDTNESTPTQSWSSFPSDKPLEEIASQIEFIPPTETSTANVSWGIKYPNTPLYLGLFDSEQPGNNYGIPYNATYEDMSPTNLSYGFDFKVDESEANLDITWEMGKLTNTSAYNAVQGYGLVMPQYNFFLSSFDIDEVDQPFLSVPRDTFSFMSNDTVVAEINMGASKKNYTLYNSTASMESVFPSAGGSIHKNVLQFVSENSFYDNPLINGIFTLRDAVAADTSFIVQDDLFSMETQNYPIWSGEKIVHDPSLIIYHGEPPESPADDEAIPGYNLPLLIGVVGIMTSIIVRKYRNKHNS
ncbi:MAG: hypothetical protein KGD58_01555 [Candidatus Lokiarchaeota archaeon]|nr:hypothetical protein [Candidatus Lokiarchaeota archaeon]